MQMQQRTLGIILAGGRSSRLYPATFAATKQVLPIYDKPLIYYPLATLMLAGVKDFVVITNPNEKHVFEQLFEDHMNTLGIKMTFAVQTAANGIADAFNVVHYNLGDKLADYTNFALILGDNIFHGATMTGLLRKANDSHRASIFATKVPDPERFGVVEIKKGVPVSLIEKPENPKSDLAVTGLYFYPADVFDLVYHLRPSDRGELEITDLNTIYLNKGILDVHKLARGVVWFDTGTPDSMMEASTMIQTLQKHQDNIIGSPHEVAYTNGWISDSQLRYTANLCSKTAYGQYLMSIINDSN